MGKLCLTALALVAFVAPAAAQSDPGDDLPAPDDPDGSILGPSTGPSEPSDGDEPPPDVAPPEPGLDPAVAREMAKKLVAGGDAFRTKGNYYVKRKKPDKARERYERAYEAYSKAFELSPDLAILLKVANMEEKLERWFDAALHYRRFLAEATDPSAADKAEAESHLEALKLHLGVLTLAVTPEGAAVVIDGTPVGTAPLAEPILLAPGEHTLSITADGYQPTEQTLNVEAGSEAERTFELEPVPAVIVDTAPPPPPPPPPPPLPPGPSKLGLIAGGGVTLGLVGGAVATGLMAQARHDVFVDEMASASARENARKSGQNLALVTDLMLVGGVAAAAVTTYYYLKVYRPKVRAHERLRRERAMSLRNDDLSWRAPDPRPKLLVMPWVEASGPATAGGLVIGGAL